ncbi:MAG: SpoIIE family protein phosphatase [Actinobacteria bacterium]|nr:SpoIIE family protein phosphatase [Actinomycetota bacterium]
MMEVRVLLIEDSDDDVLLVLRELAQGGYEVTGLRVEDTEEGTRQALSDGPWDLVLADYSLPAFDAVSALRLLQATGQDIPFIIVSGTITEETAVAAMKAGAHDYVHKGNLARLAPAVDRELKEAANRRAQQETLAKHDELRLLHSELQLAARLRQSLITVGQDLASTLDFDEVLSRAVAEGAEVLGADAAVLEMRTEGGWFIRESYGLARRLRGLTLKDEEARLAALADRERKALVMADAAIDGRLDEETRSRFSMASVLVVPLTLHEQVIGVILLAHSSRARAFGEAHLEFARNLSLLVALALENARLYGEQKLLAHKLEATLLNIPKVLPELEISHVYRSATHDAHVGGDFYDVFEAKDGLVGLLIGDVSGHGVEAARIATLVRDTVQAFAHQFRRPHLVLRETNRLLAAKQLPGFTTVFLGLLNPHSGNLVYSSAGHPPPLLTNNGRVVPLESAGSPLGVFRDARYHDGQINMPDDSLLLLYTDGVTEARSQNGFFGEERLSDSLTRARGRPVDRVPSMLLEDALRFSDGHLDDDVALLAVNYRRKASTKKDARS